MIGPAGSGKATTLYALLQYIVANEPGLSVIALEDPVERDLPGVTQIEVRPHGELTYERAPRSILRQDPQVLMLGEIRDAATASPAALREQGAVLSIEPADGADEARAVITASMDGQSAQQVVTLRPTGELGAWRRRSAESSGALRHGADLERAMRATLHLMRARRLYQISGDFAVNCGHRHIRRMRWLGAGRKRLDAPVLLRVE